MSKQYNAIVRAYTRNGNRGLVDAFAAAHGLPRDIVRAVLVDAKALRNPGQGIHNGIVTNPGIKAALAKKAATRQANAAPVQVASPPTPTLSATQTLLVALLKKMKEDGQFDGTAAEAIFEVIA